MFIFTSTESAIPGLRLLQFVYKSMHCCRKYRRKYRLSGCCFLKSKHSLMLRVQSHTSIAASEAYAASVLSVTQQSATCNILLKMFDFSLLLSPTCLILCFGGVLPFLGTLSYSFVVSYMNQKNFAKFPQLMHVQTTFVFTLRV